jgi:uncharacterized protein YcfL
MKKIIFSVFSLSLLFSCATSKTINKVGEEQSIVNEAQVVSGKTEAEKKHYWQQKADYKMHIVLNTEKHQYSGKQKLVYTNNSQDTLYNIYYHLYWNAFQPGSAMDWRNRTLEDPDRGLDTKIKNLKPDEIGFTKISSLKQNGSVLKYKVVGTILEVQLNKPVLPGASSTFEMDYLTQIPILLRRGGRNNSEGIDYSMSQWYPKLCEYDAVGWHTDPYIGREFYGVWGDYDVRITLPKKYTVASTGYLQNPEEVGKGYPSNKDLKIPAGNTLTWHFAAQNVHDFSWAADPDYIHDITEGPNGMKLHFFYQKDVAENWKKLQPVVAKTFAFYNQFVGMYPYKKYSVIQAGDGGMEYAMNTFVQGKKPYNSLRGTVQHELGHSWFQFAVATNESQYPWMDEGFTSYIQDMANVYVNGKQDANPFAASYDSYRYLVSQKKDEPLNTHGDHYNTNIAYWIGAYDKGKLTLTQLGYIIGFKKLNAALKDYYKNWAMKHPQPDDFFHIVEKNTNINVKWFQNDWLETTHHIDYAVDTVEAQKDKTLVTIQNKGQMPMPLDILVVYADGSKEFYYIATDLMRGVKDNPFPGINRVVLSDWFWTVPEYKFTINKPKSEIKAIAIDPLGFMADIHPENNFKEFK